MNDFNKNNKTVTEVKHKTVYLEPTLYVDEDTGECRLLSEATKQTYIVNTDSFHKTYSMAVRYIAHSSNINAIKTLMLLAETNGDGKVFYITEHSKRLLSAESGVPFKSIEIGITQLFKDGILLRQIGTKNAYILNQEYVSTLNKNDRIESMLRQYANSQTPIIVNITNSVDNSVTNNIEQQNNVAGNATINNNK